MSLHPENLPVDPAVADLSTQRALSEWLPGRLAAEQPAVLVIGDLMLDGWWSGSIERLCREAPAPVVDLQVRESVPGGAANTAMNLAALGARVSVAGIVGTDDAGEDLRSQLVAVGIDVTHLHSHPDMVTTTASAPVAASNSSECALTASTRSWPSGSRRSSIRAASCALGVTRSGRSGAHGRGSCESTTSSGRSTSGTGASPSAPIKPLWTGPESTPLP